MWGKERGNKKRRKLPGSVFRRGRPEKRPVHIRLKGIVKKSVTFIVGVNQNVKIASRTTSQVVKKRRKRGGRVKGRRGDLNKRRAKKKYKVVEYNTETKKKTSRNTLLRVGN